MNVLFSVVVSIMVLRSGAAVTEVEVSAESTQVISGDPVLVKVVAFNTSMLPLPFAPPLYAQCGNLWFLVRGPREVEYQYLHGVSASCPVTPNSAILPGARVVAYTPFFGGFYGSRSDKVIFVSPGDWEFVAVVFTGAGEVRSKPHRVRVLPRDVDSHRDLVAIKTSLDSAVHSGLNPLKVDDVLLLEKARPSLTGSSAGLVAEQAVALAALRVAHGDVERRLALEALDALRKRLSPIAREYHDFRLAAAYIDRKDVVAAELLLRGIGSESAEGEALRGRLKRLRARSE